MQYIKQKRNQLDRCNICGKQKQLTWDHIPPKAVLSEPNTYANTLFFEPELPTANHHMHHFQNGIKYRTICADCNNAVLGQNDKDYKLFVDEVKSQIESYANAIKQGIVIPRSITVNTKINRVLRAVCGHFLAMKAVYDDQTLTDLYLRRYVLDDTLKLEKERVFCWFYPYPTILNVRDFTTRGHNNQTHPKGFISVMMAYPLGYMISSEDEVDCQVDNLGKYATTNIDERVPVTLHFDTSFYAGTKTPKHLIWPANISDDKYGALLTLGNMELMEGSRLGVTTRR